MNDKKKAQILGKVAKNLSKIHAIASNTPIRERTLEFRGYSTVVRRVGKNHWAGVLLNVSPEISIEGHPKEIKSIFKKAVIKHMKLKAGMVDVTQQSISIPIPPPAPTIIDLHPWPFENQTKGCIQRSEWNALVKSIQDQALIEVEAENAQLNEHVKKLLNDGDAMKETIRKMSEDMQKFSRSFLANYGV